ncbi:DEAD/DEAH box helicase [Microlunatus antarcticus]|uniref:RNA helicase n=1 Tax=Microlunatus antarcticus TaxID=53388 RepID=A0A7W5JWM5_9ACTN|nr:superfamily II DNA/RNA helicase [Microlunatus antarcticus]
MAIPIALSGTDMIGQARTGTGKTLAFGIVMLQRASAPGEAGYDELAKPGAPQGLVVCPTRELASQVSKDLSTAAALRPIRVLTVYGGVGYDAQLDALKNGVDVVVGTPGRLLDLADRRVLDLSHLKTLVLDEADEMLDLGFLPDVERLLAKTPASRQTMLFSATMPSAIVTLARRHLEHPVNIRAESADDETTVPATAQFVYQAHMLDKPEVVARILQAQDRGRVMIFSRTKRSAQRLTDDLVERGFEATSIHGDLNQVAREKALKRFREGKVDVLVATDVAARGIDVTGVTHVINYECPDDEKTYVHRIGRTGRAGASGIAITFVDWADQTRWKVINNALGLPFPEPEETYSTSAHLFHDMGIDPSAKGRLNEPTPEPPREREAGSRDRDRGRRRGEDRAEGRGSDAKGSSSKGADDKTEGKAEGRTEGAAPSRSRNRRRLRNGVVADESAATTDAAETPVVAAAAEPTATSGDVPVVEPTQQVETSDAAETATEGTGDGEATKRRRRRRGGRGRGRTEQGGAEASSDESGPADAAAPEASSSE